MNVERSLEGPGGDAPHSLKWEDAIDRIRTGRLEDMGASELVVGALDHSRSLGRWVYASLALNISIALATAVVALSPYLPRYSILQVSSQIDVWQITALLVGSLWLFFAGLAFVRRQAAERLIVKTYLVDAWLDRATETSKPL